jgi:hypothetical protein
MAVGLPLKTTYLTGDVYQASDVNDTNGTINANATPYAAGKNKIINGDFRINQRGFTSNTTTLSFNFDRWFQSNGGTTGTLTVTPQTFTPGAAPIAGYEGSTFLQGVTAAGASADTVALFQQRIEDVRSFAGQTITFSFFARATTGTPKIGLEISQNFGTGGSPSATVMTSLGAVTISTSWARYSLTLAVPSISGKTLGTTNNSFLAANLWLSAGSDSATRASSIGLQNNTFQIWGVQIENGSTATPFQTATGTIQGELAACCRYFESYKSTQNDAGLLVGTLFATNTFIGSFPYSEKRTEPSFTVVNPANFDIVFGGTVKDSTGLTITFSNPNKKWTQIAVSSTGTPFTLGNGAVLRTDLNFEIQISAEL